MKYEITIYVHMACTAMLCCGILTICLAFGGGLVVINFV